MAQRFLGILVSFGVLCLGFWGVMFGFLGFYVWFLGVGGFGVLRLGFWGFITLNTKA